MRNSTTNIIIITGTGRGLGSGAAQRCMICITFFNEKKSSLHNICRWTVMVSMKVVKENGDSAVLIVLVVQVILGLDLKILYFC